jgi:soluble lytic murein transglycosylase-like protein
MAEHIIEEAKINQMRPTLVAALIYVESGWRRKVVSPANACGLTQIIPKWTGSVGTGVPRLTCEKLFNPKTSITMGARLMKFWIKNYAKGNEQIGLCGYNSGYRCHNKRPFKKGMRYARAVLSIEKKIILNANKLKSTPNNTDIKAKRND